MHDLSNVERGFNSLEVVLLSVPAGYNCVDLSLYKVGPSCITWQCALFQFQFQFHGVWYYVLYLIQESQLVLLLNETSTSSENSGEGCMMIVQASDLPFVPISRSTKLNHWELHHLKVNAAHTWIEQNIVGSCCFFVLAPWILFTFQ